MKKNVVILGAGASYGAREPKPPLGNTLHKWVLDYFREKYDELSDWENSGEEEINRKRIKKLLEEATSFESMANDLQRQQRGNDLAKLNFLLAASMTPPLNLEDTEPRVNDAFIEKPDLFDGWLKKSIGTKEKLGNTSFITLNYDCLLERAICRTYFTQEEKESQCLCNHICYHLTEDPQEEVEVFKLHGSINWIGDPTKEIEFNSHRPDYQTIKVVPSLHGELDEQDPTELILASYANGKLPQANLTTLQKIRGRALEQITKAANIEIIGVHIPPHEDDDPSLWEVLQHLKGKTVDFINPSRVENDLAKSKFSFNVIRKTFREYVDSLT